MTILVTGASGLIGSALVTTLTEHGHRAVRLVRPGAGSPPPAAAADGRPETVDWDPSRGTVNVAGLEAACHTVQVVEAGARAGQALTRE